MPRPRKALVVQERDGRAHISTAERAERTERENASLAGTYDHMEPPSYLPGKKTKDRFRLIVDILHGCSEKLCTDADVDSVARYVLVEAEYLEASKDLRSCRTRQKREAARIEKMKVSTEPDVVTAAYKAESGLLSEKRQLQQAYNQAFRSVNDAARAIGLTVDGRLRFDLREPERKPANKFGGFEGGRP